MGGVTYNDLILNGDLSHLDRYCDVLIDNAVELVWDGQATAHRVMNKGLDHPFAQSGPAIGTEQVPPRAVLKGWSAAGCGSVGGTMIVA